MIAAEETLKRIRAQAEAYAVERINDNASEILTVSRETLRSMLGAAYLRGADAGYTAALAEQRQP